MDAARRDQLALVGRVVLGILMIAAGIVHFVNPEPFMLIMPDYLPLHAEAVFVSGVAEVALGVGLFVPRPELRVWVGWGLIALYLAVWPANIWMATENIALPGTDPSPTIAWIRVALQPLFMVWAWVVTRPPRADEDDGSERS